MNNGLYVKGVIDRGEDDFYSIIHHIYEFEYIGLSKKILLFYCEWFDLTINVGTKFYLQYNIVEVKLNGRYVLYDPFILPQKERQAYFVNYLNICKNLCGWYVAITIKSWAHVQVDHVSDELTYQTNESPTVIPILTINLVQGLADTTVLEVLDDDLIKPVDDDTYEDLDFSDEVDEQSDNNDEQDLD